MYIFVEIKEKFQGWCLKVRLQLLRLCFWRDDWILWIFPLAILGQKWPKGILDNPGPCDEINGCDDSKYMVGVQTFATFEIMLLAHRLDSKRSHSTASRFRHFLTSVKGWAA